MKSRLLILLMLLAFLPFPARAAITQQGAAKVKALVESYIAEQKKLSGMSGQDKIDYEGDVTVELAGDYYAVTLPYMKVLSSNGNTADIGMVSINASEGDEPGQWKMRVALPTPIVITKAGAELYRITLGSQSAAGVWDETMRGFIKLDANYKDIELIEKAPGTGSLKIPKAQIVYNLAKDAGGTWSGPVNMTLSDISGTVPQTGLTVQAKSVKTDLFLDHYNAGAFAAYRQKMAQLSSDIQRQIDKGPMNAKLASSMLDVLIESLTSAGNGMKVNYQVSGLRMGLPAQKNNPARDLKLSGGNIGIDIGNLQSGRASLGIKANYNGLNISPEPPESEGLTPSDFALDIRSEQIPLKELVALSKNTLQSTLTGGPEMQQLAGISFMFKLPALLAQSGTTLTISDTHFGNKDYEVKAEGVAKADMTSPTFATANAKAVFRGLDSLIAKLQARQKTMSPPDARKLQSTITTLFNIKRSARVEQAPNGQTLHIIELVVNQKGQVLLNGNDALRPKPKTGAVGKAPVPDVEKSKPVP